MMIYPSNIKPIPERPTRDHDQSRLDSARLNSTWTNSALLSPLLQLDSTSPCLTESTSLASLCFSTYYLLQRYPLSSSSSSLPIKNLQPENYSLHTTKLDLTCLDSTYHVWRFTFDVWRLPLAQNPTSTISRFNAFRLTSTCQMKRLRSYHWHPSSNSSSSSSSLPSSCISYTTQLEQWIVYHC